jgi:hypothetical protein
MRVLAGDNRDKQRQRRAGFGGFILLVGLLATPLCLSATTLSAPDRTPTEYEVKAAYIFYFAKFVSWPDNAFPARNAPLIIGVVGDDEFGALLQRIVKDKTIQEHSISVRILKKSEDPKSCHIVYVASSELKRLNQLTESTQERPVLTVTEAEPGSQGRGIMNLFLEAGKVEFEVDLNGADRARLQISSKLLRLAKGTTPSRIARRD